MEWDGEEERLFSDDEAKFEENEIHIRKQIRRGRKYLTTVENIPESYNVNVLLGILKKGLSCNGTITIDPVKNRKIVQMQGDHGEKIREHLRNIFPTHVIVFHGN